MATAVDPPQPRALSLYSLFLLLMIFAGHLVANVNWIRRDNTWRSYDMGLHLHAAMKCQEVLRQEGPVGLARVLRGGDNALVWPSAAYLPWATMAALFGHNVGQFRCYNLFYFAVLLFSIYICGRRLGGETTGVVAAALVGLFPVIYGESRQVGLDLPGTAMNAAAMALLLGTATFARTGRAALFGVVVGLGILVRPQSAFLVAAPALLVFVFALARPISASRLRVLANVALALLMAGITSAVWWFGRVQGILNGLMLHTRGQEVMSSSTSVAVSLAKSQANEGAATSGAVVAQNIWLIRIRDFAELLPPSFSPFLLLAALVACWFLLRRGRGFPLWWLLAWLLGGTVFLQLSYFLDVRYLAPLCPALALLTAVALTTLPSERWRGDLIAVCITVAVALALHDSFGSPKPQFYLGQEDAPNNVESRPFYAANGPPMDTELLGHLDAVSRFLRRRHRSGHRVWIAVSTAPEFAPHWHQVFHWRAGPMLATMLPHVTVQDSKSWHNIRIRRPQKYQVFGSAEVPIVRVQSPRHCYALRFANVFAYPKERARLLFKSVILKEKAREDWIQVLLFKYRRCPRYYFRNAYPPGERPADHTEPKRRTRAEDQA